MSFLDRIKLEDFPTNQYIREQTPKTMIHLHHTASNANPFNVLEYWATTEERVATHFVIAGTPPKGVTGWYDGQIIQAYSTKYWGYHLGLQAKHFPKSGVVRTSKYLNSFSIGIELCNWGPLELGADGKFRNWNGGIVPANQVISLSYRGHNYWHLYSDAQIESCRDLIKYLGEKWKITVKFKGLQMFNINARAFAGEPGVWTHTSFRPDKTDCSPQPKLIDMLSSL